MAKSHILSTAAKPADLEKAYNSAVKALGLIGMKMVTKKPDPTKIAPFMIKSNSKAEFLLSHDGKLAKLTVECDSMVNTLGVFDVEKERNEEKRLAILENLMTAGLISKADYEKELKDAKAAAGPDPKVVANLRREIEAAQKKYDKFAAPTAYDAMIKLPELEAALRAAAKAQYMSENFDFLDAVEKRMKPNDLITMFILPNSKKQINIDSGLVTDITMDPKKITLAVDEIKQLIQTNIRKPALKTLADERDEVIKDVKKKLKDLGVDEK